MALVRTSNVIAYDFRGEINGAYIIMTVRTIVLRANAITTDCNLGENYEYDYCGYVIVIRLKNTGFFGA